MRMGQTSSTKYSPTWEKTSAKEVKEQSACVSDGGGSQAEIRTEYQRYTAGQIAARNADGQVPALVWLGAINPAGQSNLAWISDHLTVDVPLTWWINETVQESKDGQMCLTMDKNSLLTTSICGTERSFVCQRYVDNPCDVFLPGGIYYENTCFLPVAKNLTFDQADPFLVRKPFLCCSGGVGGTMDSESALTFVGTLLLRARAPPWRPGLTEGPKA
ncbi:hypothetical protein PoB_002943200 [Plakobranchus ocellatus]|uniref:C-type lectin domain-containing protein n=1 Tax=Plakobranchus ocellatus TaxID=259542 RepID=A0AAV4A7N3_9GAST|nr:hypothetical protein PoB_002943200 [Plakobranchus ocellatus]